jgi:DNA-binding transcriptional ArsR family regulator
MATYRLLMNKLERTAARLEALGNPTRLRIYRLLVRAGAAGRPVGKIQERLDIPASTLTHHLRQLETVGLVERHRSGTTHFCSANYEAMSAVLAFLTEECCVEGQTDAANDSHRPRSARA